MGLSKAFASRAMGKKLKTIEELNDAVSDSDGFSFHEIKVVNDWKQIERKAFRYSSLV